MKKIQKLAFAKAIDAEQKTVTGYASTFQWDRDGERFVKGAWDLSSYQKNPVVLWAHDPYQAPIAKCTGIVEDETGLRVMAQFDEKSERSMEIFSLMQRGFINAFSVGFIRKSFVVEDRGEGQKGIAITQAELYEFSAVSIPANPGALVTRDVAELAEKALGPGYVEKVSVKGLGDESIYVVTGPRDPDEAAGGGEQPEDLEPALKQVIELARVTKGSPLTESKRALITTAMSVFNELIAAHQTPADLTAEDLDKLKGALTEFAGVVAGIYPAAGAIINRTLSQIDKAVTGRAAA
jgi:HK97 family phage prohead protease